MEKATTESTEAKRLGGVFFAAVIIILFAACAMEVQLPERYAIVYGVSDYYGGSEGLGGNLTWSDDDAAGMAAMLAARGWHVIRRVQGKLNGVTAVSEQPTRTNLAADIATLAGMPRDGMFLFYFSGHGAQYGQKDPANEGTYAADTINEYLGLYNNPGLDLFKDDDLMALIKNIPARTKMAVIDVCFSGGFIGDSYQVDLIPANSSSPSAAFTELADAYARYFGQISGADLPASQVITVTAAGEQQSSWEASGFNHGIFTWFFLEAARNGDLDRDGWVTLTEAYEYTRRAIDQNWNPRVIASQRFLPHISGGPIDPVLFKAD